VTFVSDLSTITFTGETLISTVIQSEQGNVTAQGKTILTNGAGTKN